MYQKLTKTSLAIIAGIALISCNSGSSNSSPTPAPTIVPPAPSSQWVDSGLKTFLNSSDLISYNFDTSNIIDNQQKLYLTGSNGTQKAIIAFDLNSQMWSNVTYGLNNSDVTLKLPYLNGNSQVYATSNNQLYVLGTNSWQAVGTIPNGYRIQALSGNDSRSFTLLLVTNGTNSIVYRVNGTNLTSIATLNFVATQISIANDNKWIAYSDDKYILSSDTASILNLPYVSNPSNRYISSNAGTEFIYQGYLCNATGCTQITGASPNILPSTNYSFVSASLSNSVSILHTNTIGYNSGKNYYTCDFNNQTAVASNCIPVAPYVGESEFVGIYSNINNNNVSIGRSINRIPNLYTIIDNTWTNIVPTTKPNNVDLLYALPYCIYNPTSSISYAITTQFIDNYTKLITNAYYAEPFGNEWVSLNVPDNGDFSTVGNISSVDNSTITIKTYGFKSITSQNGHVVDLYTYKYNAPCSKTF